MKTLVFVLFQLLLVTQMSCKKDNKAGNTNQNLNGTWKSTSGTSDFGLQIGSDNKYAITGGTSTLEEGTYTLSNTNITFISFNSSMQCTGFAGLYNYNIADTILSTTKVNDSCTQRSVIMGYNWSK